MNFTIFEIEEVLNFYKDKSQDPKWISKETGIELDKVEKIIDYLSNKGEIEPINENNDGGNYFFDHISVGKTYRPHPDILIYLHEIHGTTKTKQNPKIMKVMREIGAVEGILFYFVVKSGGFDQYLLVLYDSKENVHCLPVDPNMLDRMFKGDMKREFLEIIDKIISYWVPFDIWDVISKSN